MSNLDLERRRQRRVKAQISVRLDYSNNEALALTKNISLLGACANMDKQILPGTRVAFSIAIPGYVEDESLIGEAKGEGAIVRCDAIEEAGQQPKYEAGIFFSNFLPSGEKKLLSYLDYIAKEEEKEVRQWVQQYREHIRKRRLKIARKKRELERKRQARLAKRALKQSMQKRKVGRPRKGQKA